MQPIDKNQLPVEVPIMIGGVIQYENLTNQRLGEWLVMVPDPSFPNDRNKDILDINYTKLNAFAEANGWTSTPF